MTQNFTAIIESDRDMGLYVGYTPNFPGAHSQGKTLDELRDNLSEVIEMLMEDWDPQLETEIYRDSTNCSAIRMSGKIPVLTPQEVSKILIRLGFIKVRQKGSP